MGPVFAVSNALKKVIISMNIQEMENSWASIWRKTRVFCSMLFTVPSTGVFYRIQHFVERKDMVKNQTKDRVFAQKPRVKIPFKNSVSGFFLFKDCRKERMKRDKGTVTFMEQEYSSKDHTIISFFTGSVLDSNECVSFTKNLDKFLRQF
jgi:hypothetical protein